MNFLKKLIGFYHNGIPFINIVQKNIWNGFCEAINMRKPFLQTIKYKFFINFALIDKFNYKKVLNLN